jgi:hypothetical protein
MNLSVLLPLVIVLGAFVFAGGGPGAGRKGSEWELVHRHADPLVNRISVEQAAALAKGSQP